MTGQPALFEPAPRLTVQQQAVLELAQRTAGGITPDEAGATAHSLMASRWAHSPEKRCEYCANRGHDILASRALRRLLVRRKETGRWEPRDSPGTVPGPGPAEPAAGLIAVSHTLDPSDPFHGL